MALVQSVIRWLPNSLCPTERIQLRTHVCKWSLLKFRERKYKGEHGRHRYMGRGGHSAGKKSEVLFSGTFIYSFLFHCFYIYSHVYTLFVPPLPCFQAETVPPLVLEFCWRESIGDNKKDSSFLLIWGKNSYTERFLALLPSACITTHIGSSLPDLFTIF
jgi:hypothetical protein